MPGGNLPPKASPTTSSALPSPYARREVEQRYARRHRRLHGGDAFLDRRLAP